MANPNLVGYPTGGITAIALRSATSPSKANMADASFVITTIPGWLVLGLRKTGGAPQWTETPGGIDEVYEEGYGFSKQDGTLGLTQNIVELNTAALALLRNATYASGVADLDVNIMTEIQVYTEDKLKMHDGTFMLERYMAPQALVTAINRDQKERGAMSGTPVTFAAYRSDAIDNRGHYRHALISASATPLPYIAGIAPNGKKIGDQVVITGGKFTGMTSVKFNATSVTTPLLADDGTIVATIPAAIVGTAAVTVITAAGTSPAFNYAVAV